MCGGRYPFAHFFFYSLFVLQLAKKLKECQVFGVSSDECLNYAVQNRNEWEQRGEQILEDMKAELGIVPAPPLPPLGKCNSGVV